MHGPATPNLDLDGIAIVAKEAAKGEGFLLPSFLEVDCEDWRMMAEYTFASVARRRNLPFRVQLGFGSKADAAALPDISQKEAQTSMTFLS